MFLVTKQNKIMETYYYELFGLLQSSNLKKKNYLDYCKTYLE